MKSSHSLALIPTLFLSILGLTACERMEPALETSVVLQAAGGFGIYLNDGALDEKESTLLLTKESAGLLLEVKEKLTQRTLLTGHLPGETLSHLMQGVRGPLVSSFAGTTLRVSQQGLSGEKSVVGIQTTEGPRAGVLQLEGRRWMAYSAGMVEHGLDGRIHLTLKGPDGKEAGFFDGMTTTGTPQRRAVGTDVHGKITGSFNLGGGIILGNAARLYLALATGSGAIVMDDEGQSQSFRFDPRSDLTPAGGLGSARLVSETQDLVEVSDSFEGRMAMKQVNITSTKTAAGAADIRFDIQVAVTSEHIVVYGTSSIDAVLQTSGGERSEFHGSNPKIQTELDW